MDFHNIICESHEVSTHALRGSISSPLHLDIRSPTDDHIVDPNNYGCSSLIYPSYYSLGMERNYLTRENFCCMLSFYC